MPPLPQLSPEEEAPSHVVVPHEAANEDHFFNDGVCVEILSKEDTLTLFKKRKAVDWMAHNRTDGNAQETYRNEMVRIMKEMKRYNLSEADYQKFLVDIGEVVD